MARPGARLAHGVHSHTSCAGAAAVAALLLGAPRLASQSSPAPPVFTDVSAASGLPQGSTTLAVDDFYFVETMGGGGGFVDVNGDGRLDVYLVAYSIGAGDGGIGARDRLYLNDGNGVFRDVTASSGLSQTPVRGMGLSVGDVNDDGVRDLYVSAYQGGRLYLGGRNGTFQDATGRSGLTPQPWGTGAAFLDHDRDGDLDLFVANYVSFSIDSSASCVPAGRRRFCRPSDFRPLPSALFRNDGQGRFEAVTASAGLARHLAKGLGVLAFDYNNDGWLDVFQANDTTPNFLFRNRKDGTFDEIGLPAQVAYDVGGQARGGMGVHSEDVDGNGFADVFVANFVFETNSLFLNGGDDLFTEVTHAWGLGRVSLPMSGFGAQFLDYDNDGHVDLFVHNGHPLDSVSALVPGVEYEEPPFLFRNAGRTFVEMAARHGGPLARKFPGRGLAVGDIDDDGDPDLLLMNVGTPPVLLRNDGGNARAWFGVDVRRRGGGDAIGARVEVLAGGRRRWKMVQGGGSYLSASDPRLLFGLGDAKRVEEVVVTWPDGSRTTLGPQPIRQYVTIRQR